MNESWLEIDSLFYSPLTSTWAHITAPWNGYSYVITCPVKKNNNQITTYMHWISEICRGSLIQNLIDNSQFLKYLDEDWEIFKKIDCSNLPYSVKKWLGQLYLKRIGELFLKLCIEIAH